MIYLPNKKAYRAKNIDLQTVYQYVTTSKELTTVTKEELPLLKVSANKINGLKDKHVLKHSSYIHLDIDMKHNLDTDFQELKEELKNDDYVALMYNSFSGGLKLIIKTDIQDTTEHKIYYRQCFHRFQNKYNVKLDTSCTNISRNCFIYYDEQAYINPNSEPYTILDAYKPFLKIVVENEEKKRKLKDKSFTCGVDKWFSTSTLVERNVDVDGDASEDCSVLAQYYPEIFNVYRFPDITPTKLNELKIKANYAPVYQHYTKIHLKYMKEGKAYISEGIPFAEINLKNCLIKSGHRNKTIGVICMKLIFNNPLLTMQNIFNEVQRINEVHCEEVLDENEVQAIVQNNFKKYLKGEMNFYHVIRKTNKGLSLKHTFSTKDVEIPLGSNKKEVMTKFYQENKRNDTVQKIYSAIEVLQDGKKITKARIAESVGMSEDTVKRNWKEFKAMVEDYNNSLRGASVTQVKVILEDNIPVNNERGASVTLCDDVYGTI